MVPRAAALVTVVLKVGIIGESLPLPLGNLTGGSEVICGLPAAIALGFATESIRV
eukprot:COSAG03_NODE_24321_length_273_cov_0.597701_1_plen_54_part_10